MFSEPGLMVRDPFPVSFAAENGISSVGADASNTDSSMRFVAVTFSAKVPFDIVLLIALTHKYTPHSMAVVSANWRLSSSGEFSNLVNKDDTLKIPKGLWSIEDDILRAV